MKLEFEVKCAELLKPLRELEDQYEERLEELLDQVTRAGELEKALVVKKELENYKNVTTTPARDFAELSQLQKDYAADSANRVEIIDRRLEPVVDAYKRNLLTLQQKLTREKRLEEAVAVKKALEGADAITAGQFPVDQFVGRWVFSATGGWWGYRDFSADGGLNAGVDGLGNWKVVGKQLKVDYANGGSIVFNLPIRKGRLTGKSAKGETITARKTD